MSAGVSIHTSHPATGRDLPPALIGAIAFWCFVLVFYALFVFEGPTRHPNTNVVTYDSVVSAPRLRGAINTSDVIQSNPADTANPSEVTSPVKPTIASRPSEKVPSPPKQVTRPSDGVPRLAIVIDDWGYPSTEAAAFLRMEIPLTAAVIPFLPASVKYATQAAAAGFDVLLHLPMEPENSKLRIDGMVTTDMSDQVIAETVNAALLSLPAVAGMNNHMGSKATADERVMRAVLEVVREKQLIYLDSRTTSNSAGAATAVELGLPLLENNVFLDGEANREYIHKRLLKAARLAKERGVAVAIGHVRPVTAGAINSALVEIENMGVRLVRITELTEGSYHQR